MSAIDDLSNAYDMATSGPSQFYDTSLGSDFAQYIDPNSSYGGASSAEQDAINAAAVAAGMDPSTMKAKTPSLTDSLWNSIVGRYATPGGAVDWLKAAKDGLTAAAAITAYNQASKPTTPTGYQGGIPSYTAVREQLPQQATSRPGAGGQRYFTDTAFAAPAGLPAAQAAIAAQAAQRNTQNQAQAAAQPAAAAAPANYDAFFGRTPKQIAEQPQPVQAAAHGGLMGMAHGKYLRGATDGMADDLPAQIGEDQPAKLSHGEFVIPADVVSHLGNGNSDAGADQLYKMMDNIRKARTGTTKQGKQIDPEKFTPGGLAHAYAAGGHIPGYATGGDVTGAAVSSGVTGTESNLSNWAGPYVTDMLAKGQALSNQPYQAYQGPLTAGPSGLQQQAFGEAGALQTPASIGQAADTAGTVAGKMGELSYNPTGGTFDAAKAQQYMNPYLQASLDPQLAEARRQSEITQAQNAAKMTSAGAFGGGRQAIMDTETQRNLGTNLANITGQGYNTAFTQAQNQYNTEQGRNVQENQFGSTYGLQALQGELGAAGQQATIGAQQNATGLSNLNAQAGLGATQQGITQAGMTADQAAFAAERDNPYKMVQYQQSLLQGLPLAAQSYNITNNPYAAAANVVSGINSAVK